MVRVSGSIYGNDVVAWREEQRERHSVRGFAKALEVGGELQDALEVLRVPRNLPLKVALLKVLQFFLPPPTLDQRVPVNGQPW